MIIRTEDLKDNTKYISQAIDSAVISSIADLIQIKVVNKKLHFYITDKDYYLDVTVSKEEFDEDFNIIVDAKIFTKLISSITTDTVSLTIEDNKLIIKANGVYKLAKIDVDGMEDLPVIPHSNEFTSFQLSTNVLKRIMTNNIKQLDKGTFANDCQRYCYLDNKGALTFTTGACINNFDLPEDIKILLSRKVVSLFKLFSNTDFVNFAMCHEVNSSNNNIDVIHFKSSDIQLYAILPVNDLATDVPADNIREMATKVYAYQVAINRTSLIETLNRYLILGNKEDIKYNPYINIKFEYNKLIIQGLNGAFNEEILYHEEIPNLDYSLCVDLFDVRDVLQVLSSPIISFKFGDNTAVVVTSNEISNIIPEVHEL